MAIQEQQANLERAEGAPIELLHAAIDALETTVAPQLAGTSSDLREMYEASKNATSRLERQYYTTMMQLSIKYSSWFAVGPEFAALVMILKVAQARVQGNMRRRRATEGDTVAPADAMAELDALEAQTSSSPPAAPSAAPSPQSPLAMPSMTVSGIIAPTVNVEAFPEKVNLREASGAAGGGAAGASRRKTRAAAVAATDI